jgi:hypothetical protein
MRVSFGGCLVLAALGCSSQPAKDPIEAAAESPDPELPPPRRVPATVPPGTDTLVLPVVVESDVGLDAPNVLEPVQDETACRSTADCGENSAPVLGEPLFEVGGSYFSEVDLIEGEDSVRILLPFEDVDCNLGCGSGNYRLTSNSELGEGETLGGDLLPSNVPCGTDAENSFLGLFVANLSITKDGVRQPINQRHRLRYSVNDVCGASSNEIDVEFDSRY